MLQSINPSTNQQTISQSKQVGLDATPLVGMHASAGWTTEGRPYSYRRKRAFGRAMTLTFDLWPWKPFSSNFHSRDKWLCQASLKSIQ